MDCALPPGRTLCRCNDKECSQRVDPLSERTKQALASYLSWFLARAASQSNNSLNLLKLRGEGILKEYEEYRKMPLSGWQLKQRRGSGRMKEQP